MIRRTAQIAMFAAVLGAAAAVAASNPAVTGPAECCAPAERITPPSTLPPSDHVVVMGDSLTWGLVSSQVLGSSNTIQARLRGTGRSVFTAAAIGKTTPWGAGIVWSNPSVFGHADVALVGFGTNDLFGTPGLSVAQSRSAIDKMILAMRSQNPSIRIAWVDVSVERLAARTANWNRALDDAEVANPGFEVCRWRHAVLETPSWFAGDGIHLTTSGYRARRDILIGCVIGALP